MTSFLGEVEASKEQVVEFHGWLEGDGIDVVGTDGTPVVGESARAEQRATAKASGEERGKPVLDLKVEPNLDSLRLYLRSIRRVELLDAKREIALAKSIERGDLEAKQEMVEANLRLVVSIAEAYMGRTSSPRTRPGGRQGPHHPHPGAHGGQAQQGHLRRAPAGAAPGP